MFSGRESSVVGVLTRPGWRCPEGRKLDALELEKFEGFLGGSLEDAAGAKLGEDAACHVDG